jgi:SAM-dependent methyltransferase
MIKIFVIGMLLSFVQLTAHAMDEPATSSELSSKKLAYQRLKELKSEKMPVVLVVGAVPSEEDHFNFNDLSNAGVFYLNNVPRRYETNETATKDWIGKIILGDFNSIPFRIMSLYSFAKDSLDLIIPDVNVAYFMQLDNFFLRDFAETLKVGGKMLLDYNSHVGTIDFSAHINEIKATFSDEYLSSTSVGLKRNYERGKSLETDPGCAHITLGNLYDPDVPRLMVKASLIFNGGQPTEDLSREIDAQYDSYLTKWAAKYVPNCTIKLMNGVFPYRQNTNYGGDSAAPINYLEITRISDWSWQKKLG